MLIIGLGVLVGPVLALSVLTALGAHRRGQTIPLSMLVGLLFPAAWTVWYVRDEHPYRRKVWHPDEA
jgi:hypothetical protein